MKLYYIIKLTNKNTQEVCYYEDSWITTENILEAQKFNNIYEMSNVDIGYNYIKEIITILE
jgi:hypothetical protein